MSQLLQPRQTLRTETSGTECQVGRFLGGGGQGEVYEAKLQGASVALKWYFPHMATEVQRLSLEDLIGRGSPDPRFLWPMELTSDSQVAGFGYVMPLRGSDFRSINDMMREDDDPRLTVPTFRNKVTVGYQLADSFYQLHAVGLCYRDISFGNVFFHPETGEILICDNDNVAVNRQADGGVLGTQKFMAPEIVRGEAHPSVDTDLYSLAVLLFYLLLVGHPLEGLRETAIKCFDIPAAKKLYGTEPLFVFDTQDKSNRPDPTVHQNALTFWKIIPKRCRDLFTRSFTDGLRDASHGRVRETQWRALMIELRDMIVQCNKCGQENFFDWDSTRGSDASKCWNCRQVVPPPLRIKFQTRSIVVLGAQTQLFPHHIDRQRRYNFDQAVAATTRHPSDPRTWGLRNLSGSKWVATLPNGNMTDIDPGRNVRLAAGTRINFGTAEGVIEQ